MLSKKIICLFVSLLLFSASSSAQVPTEAALIENLVFALQNKDSHTYADLFPSIDSMSTWILKRADKNSEAYQRMIYLKENYFARLDFDSSVYAEADKGFKDFLKKTRQFDIRWNETVLVKYELETIRRGRGLLSEKIVPNRFLGYVQIKDMHSRRTFTFTIYDLLQVNGLWYGGELVNIFEASSKDEYEQKLAEAKKKEMLALAGIVDTTATDSTKKLGVLDEADNKSSMLKEVVDRKYYKGKFDGEIPVMLYVRYIKGGCPEGVCSWEALFKFGDEDEYVKMEVTRNEKGVWQFSEDQGGMELMLKDKVFTGTYASNGDQTEYDVKLTETPASDKKIQMLDEIFELGALKKEDD
jgi:hypothetical protein